MAGAMALLAIFAARSLCAESGDSATHANQLRAGYLLNFVRFVEWPTSIPPDRLTVCFLGASPVREAFMVGAAGKQIGNRAIVIRTLSMTDAPVECQVLYLTGELPRAWTGTILPILTVSEFPDFIHKGGIVELFTDDNHLHFNINLDTAKRSGLRISAPLLQLASRVEEHPQ
jgi:hypothetical protein